MPGGPLDGHAVLVSAVSEGTEDDVASWLEIAREVEPLFGPMPDFESTLRRNISRGTALCVRDPSGQVLGGMMLRAAPYRQIAWLAVRSSARRRGVGRALVAEALHRYPPPCEVLVDTFGEDIIEGYPARRLYESFGFLPGEDLPDGAEGGSRQRFRFIQMTEEVELAPRGRTVSAFGCSSPSATQTGPGAGRCCPAGSR